jgi:hypothetical protein
MGVFSVIVIVDSSVPYIFYSAASCNLPVLSWPVVKRTEAENLPLSPPLYDLPGSFQKNNNILNFLQNVLTVLKFSTHFLKSVSSNVYSVVYCKQILTVKFFQYFELHF